MSAVSSWMICSNLWEKQWTYKRTKYSCVKAVNWNHDHLSHLSQPHSHHLVLHLIECLSWGHSELGAAQWSSFSHNACENGRRAYSSDMTVARQVSLQHQWVLTDRLVLLLALSGRSLSLDNGGGEENEWMTDSTEWDPGKRRSCLFTPACMSTHTHIHNRHAL